MAQNQGAKETIDSSTFFRLLIFQNGSMILGIYANEQCFNCVLVGTLTHRGKSSIGYLSGHSHRWLGFCSFCDVLCHLKMNFLYQLLGSFWQGTSKHVRARFALSCAGNKCLKPKKCYFQASNGWKSDQFHVGRGDWHQLTSININFPEAIWSHVILCMLHAHDSWYSSTLPRYKRVDNGGLLEALALCSSSSILQILCNDCNERWLSCELLVRFSTVDMTPCRWCKPLRKLTSWLVCHSNGKLGWLQCLNAVAADGLRAPHLNLSLDCHRFHKVTTNVQTPTDPLCS